MTYIKPSQSLSLELAIDLLLKAGDAQALKKALVDQGLVDGFADYLIKLCNDSARFMDATVTAHSLVELVHEFSSNREQQQAVMALLPLRRA